MSAPDRPASISSSKEKSSEKHEDVEHVEDTGIKHVAEVKNAKLVTEAANAEYAAAVLQSPLDPWCVHSFRLYGCAMVAFLCSCGNGYDGSLMTGINGMDPWKHQINAGNKAESTGIIFAIYTIGQMAGALFGDKIADRWGRRAGMFCGCLIILIGTAIISTSAEQGQFIGGRFVLGMGIAVAIISAPTYIIEIAPPQWRGRMTALYNTGWNGGAIPAAAVVFATSQMSTNWSWRIPLILQAVPAGLVMLTVWFFPESPRWLFANGRVQEARDFLVKYHGSGDPDAAIVKLQMREFEEGISQQGSDKRWWDYSDLVRTHNARWRSLMVFLMGFFGQMSGNGLGYYNLDIYASLGFDSRMQFSMNLIGACTSALVAWIGVSLSDRIPRRKVLVIGSAACSALLAANAGLSAKFVELPVPKDTNIGNTAAAFFFLFGVAYGFTYTPLQALYPAECLETTARAKGVSMKIFVISCTSFINLFCIPIGMKNIGWKFMLIYVIWDAIEAVIWYFFAVETLGRTLEELDEIFSDPHPVAASKRKKKIAVEESGNVVVVDDA